MGGRKSRKIRRRGGNGEETQKGRVCGVCGGGE
jgi:hypothetical protein